MGGYIGNQVASQSADSTIYLPARQTVLFGSSTAAGVPNFMAAGTGLRVALSAAATPMTIAFANGFGTYGASDYVTKLTANASDMTGADLGASNTNYIFANYTNNASVTWGSTLIPVQYGATFTQNAQSLMRFAGADASTSFIDDYGNTWTAAANAQIDTAVQINGLNTLLLDGTGDYAECTGFTSLGPAGWTMECKVRWNTLPAASNQTIFSATNAGNFGLVLVLNDTAGTKKLSLSLSSTGSAANLANALLGTSTVWAAATTYHIAIVYDALAGKYFVYKDGVAEAALTITSALRICAVTRVRIGDNGAGTNQLNGAVAGFRFSPACRYANGVSFTAPDISTFAVEGHWFDTTGYQMWEATTASAVAATNPTFTQRYRVIVGEADTSGAAVTAVRNYAYQGRVQVDTAALGASNTFTATHTLGFVPQNWTMSYVVLVANNGYVVGEETQLYSAYFDGALDNRLVGYFDAFSVSISTRAVGMSISIKGGGLATMVTTNWKARFRLYRGW